MDALLESHVYVCSIKFPISTVCNLCQKPKGSTKTSGSPCQLDTLVPNVVTRNFILNIVLFRSGAYGEDDNFALALLVRVRR